MENEKNRRAYPRLPVYHLVKYALKSGKDEHHKSFAAIKDISGGGTCMLVNEDIPVSSLLQLYIQFPGIAQPVPCLAKVTWKKFLKAIKKYKVGVQFIEIDDVLRRQIVERVNKVYTRIDTKKQLRGQG